MTRLSALTDELIQAAAEGNTEKANSIKGEAEKLTTALKTTGGNEALIAVIIAVIDNALSPPLPPSVGENYFRGKTMMTNSGFERYVFEDSQYKVERKISDEQSASSSYDYTYNAETKTLYAKLTGSSSIGATKETKKNGYFTYAEQVGKIIEAFSGDDREYELEDLKNEFGRTAAYAVDIAADKVTLKTKFTGDMLSTDCSFDYSSSSEIFKGFELGTTVDTDTDADFLFTWRADNTFSANVYEYPSKTSSQPLSFFTKLTEQAQGTYVVSENTVSVTFTSLPSGKTFALYSGSPSGKGVQLEKNKSYDFSFDPASAYTIELTISEP